MANYFVQVNAHVMTSCLNPGIPSKDNICPVELAYNGKVNVSGTAGYENHKYCNVCNIIMPNDRHVSHCDECNICIEGNYKL
jgi:hypothetical protein